MKNFTSNHGKKMAKGGGAGGILFLGFFATLVYYLNTDSGTFWLVVLAFLKAFVWPAIIIYNVLIALHA